MTSLSRRQVDILETLASRPREQGVTINVNFDLYGSFFEVNVYARTFESFIGHAGEMTTDELNDVVDRLVTEARRDPEPAEASPRLRLVASVN